MQSRNHMRGLAARLYRFVAIIPLLLASAASFAADLVPLEDFFRNETFRDAIISPSGKYVAAAMRGGANGRLGLVILNPQDMSKSKGVASFADVDIRYVHWVNDDRLVFSVYDQKAAAADQIGGGLFVVEREGKNTPKLLIKRRISNEEDSGVVSSSGSRISGNKELSAFHYFYSEIHDGSNDIVVWREDLNDVYKTTGSTLLRLDTATGNAKVITRDGPDAVNDWTLDAQGEPRVAVSELKGKQKLYWRATPDAPWTKELERDAYGPEGGVYNPVAVGAGNKMYYVAREGGSDFSSLSRVDMTQKDAKSESLIAVDGFDFDGEPIIGRKGNLLGIKYLTDARGIHWFDPTVKAVQASMDAALPGMINIVSCGYCENPANYLVTSWSDRQPTVYRIFDPAAKTLTTIGQSRGWIKPQTMARREMKRFAARDGMSIPVHLTRPNGVTTPAPMVVLVHGGPRVRGGEWEWSAYSQFLASRGYVVIEPEFRGSRGFGHKHFRSGFKQWGLAMQDDVADATTWAIKQGYADGKRVCIAGNSYGGYATLMGLIRYPEMYRCGVEWAGVTDIELMYNARWSDTEDDYRNYGMPVLIGDPDKDAAQLVATSPLKQAAKITQPVLLAHGGTDWRVPIIHGVRFRDAVMQTNKNVEWLSYKDEGHGWLLESTRYDFWSHVEKFLEKNLKAAP
ncbi:MAG: S9 family peptidase [Betaproteobacteria bacterium]|nr:S9 family peptidase [Betaproteobacteria bacterium]